MRDVANLQLKFYFMLLSGFVFIYEAFVGAGQVLMHIDFWFFLLGKVQWHWEPIYHDLPPRLAQWQV